MIKWLQKWRYKFYALPYEDQTYTLVRLFVGLMLVTVTIAWAVT